LSNQNVGDAAYTEEAEEPPQQNGGHLLPVGVRRPLGKSYGWHRTHLHAIPSLVSSHPSILKRREEKRREEKRRAEQREEKRREEKRREEKSRAKRREEKWREEKRRKGKERKGKERKGKERKGKQRKD